ncbi:MAG: hypothetical protein EZS28_015833 [Streblomastix strix]|uniref:Uncharacterized protein n=1 Tax=Streblomastix strix TaxID=222440 RepID=A0A5J4W181_9EUKA|nr:MAG: hypothetical protein EZS28_015833 [Streblomastix strix]
MIAKSKANGPCSSAAKGLISSVLIITGSELCFFAVTPANDANPLIDSGTGVVGTSTECSRGDHQHPLQVSDDIPKRDTGTGTTGTSTLYSRDDHQHILNTDPTVANKPIKDTGSGANCNFNYYARSNHAHPLNVDPITANVSLVNATAAANGTGDYYCRSDHVHPQQLTYDGNITATKFIKSGGTDNEILLADGTTKKNVGTEGGFQSDGAKIYWRAKPLPIGSIPP